MQLSPIFLDQAGVLPFPKVTPIRLPEVIELTRKNFRFYEDDQLLNVTQLENIFRDWYRPLVDIDQFPHMYFMNNGITQALEYMSIHFKNIDIISHVSKVELRNYGRRLFCPSYRNPRLVK